MFKLKIMTNKKFFKIFFYIILYKNNAHIKININKIYIK